MPGRWHIVKRCLAVAAVASAGCRPTLAPGERERVDAALRVGMSRPQAEAALGFAGGPKPRPSWIGSYDVANGATNYYTYASPPTCPDGKVVLAFEGLQLAFWQVEPADR